MCQIADLEEIRVKDEEERLVEDFAKVYSAFSKAPAGKEDEAMDKALDAVWEHRRLEKEVKQQQNRKEVGNSWNLS